MFVTPRPETMSWYFIIHVDQKYWERRREKQRIEWYERGEEMK